MFAFHAFFFEARLQQRARHLPSDGGRRFMALEIEWETTLTGGVGSYYVRKQFFMTTTGAFNENSFNEGVLPSSFCSLVLKTLDWLSLCRDQSST